MKIFQLFLWLCASRRCFPIAECLCSSMRWKGVGEYSQHNPHHTDYTWIYRQRIVDLLTVVSNFLVCKHWASADLRSLNSRKIRTGAFAWRSRTCCWSRDSMNLVIVELIRFSGYFSLKEIPFKLSHSSANRSGEDERQWARFNIVITRERLQRASTWLW